MLVLKLELHSARTGEVKLLGTTIIGNIATSTDGKTGSYDVRVGRKTDAHDLAKVWNKPLRQAKVFNHPRLAQNVWRLVLKALAATFPETKVQLPDEDSPESDKEFDDGPRG